MSNTRVRRPLSSRGCGCRSHGHVEHSLDRGRAVLTGRVLGALRRCPRPAGADSVDVAGARAGGARDHGVHDVVASLAPEAMGNAHHSERTRGSRFKGSACRTREELLRARGIHLPLTWLGVCQRRQLPRHTDLIGPVCHPVISPSESTARHSGAQRPAPRRRRPLPTAGGPRREGP